MLSKTAYETFIFQKTFIFKLMLPFDSIPSRQPNQKNFMTFHLCVLHKVAPYSKYSNFGFLPSLCRQN